MPQFIENPASLDDVYTKDEVDAAIAAGGGGGGAVSSVDGRIGAVILSDLYAALAHTHAQSDVSGLVVALATLSSGVAASVPQTRTVSTAAPLSGGGALSGNLTLTISAATASAAGSMSSADKIKLDALPSGTQSANNVYAGPSSGIAANPTFRVLAVADIPTLTLAKISDAGSMASQSTASYYTASSIDTLLAVKAPLESPTFTGTVTIPTPSGSDDSTKAASTAFVQARIAALIGGAPANLDTLIEISNQLASDESAVAALTATVATKLAKASNLSDLTNAATARSNLSLGTMALEAASDYTPVTRTVNGYALSANVTITASDLGLGSVENTALSTWAGSANLTTVGTIATGVWSGTTIALNKGGTGQTTKAAAFDALSPMTASGDVIYGGTAGTGTRLAKGTDGQLLFLVSGLPAWSDATFTDSVALVKGSADATKKLRFEVDGFTTATTRVLTPPNSDATIAGIDIAQTFTALQTFSLGLTMSGGPIRVYAATTAYAATVTPNCDNYTRLDVGTLTNNITIANPTGTPTNGQLLKIKLVQDGTGGRTLTWGSNFSTGAISPALTEIVTTANSKQLMLFEWDATDSKWWLMAIKREA